MNEITASIFTSRKVSDLKHLTRSLSVGFCPVIVVGTILHSMLSAMGAASELYEGAKIFGGRLPLFHPFSQL